MKDKTLEQFTLDLSTKDPIPGGGGATALVGSICASLSQMVTSLTAGKKTYAKYEEENQMIAMKAEILRAALLNGIQEDADAFLPLAKAYSMDKSLPEYPTVMEECLRNAAKAPADLLERLCDVIELDERLAETGSKLAISDAATSAALAGGALYAALINIRVNTRLMKDRDYAEEMDRKYAALAEEYRQRAEKVYQRIEERLNG
ncbi:MAG: cyclodeaminase/cyclohydrolase family protein [Erysipelotrichaceae bacterium]|nr:cyclodeaminase/cyclohydrolase family protein [Erysipelotrichaceae bacterium]